ncbi:MAG: HmuY family protein [Myxococcota bacterium]|nr:HmuY family protein [Myxococcota bacterium]
MRGQTTVVWLTCLLGACAPDLREDYPFDGDLPDGDYVTFQALEGGVEEGRVNAGQPESWVFVDLDGRRQVPGSEAIGTVGWDLGFQRFKIISNSGVSGVGPLEVAILPGADFSTLTQAPTGGYQVDAADGPDSNSEVDSAFLIDDGWYSYDLLNHGVQPRDLVYVVHTDQGYLALRLLAYYDEAGTAARIRFQQKALTPP